MGMLGLTKAEEKQILKIMEDEIRNFFRENRLYEELILDMLKSYPESYGMNADRLEERRQCIRKLAEMVGVKKAEEAIAQYIDNARIILRSDMGEEFPEELTEEVYRRVVKDALLKDKEILSTLVGSIAVTALCEKFYYPRLVHEMMRKVSKEYDQNHKSL